MNSPHPWSLIIQSYAWIVAGARHHCCQLLDEETRQTEDVRKGWTEEQRDTWARESHRAWLHGREAPDSETHFLDYREMLDCAIAQWLNRGSLADGAGSVLYRGNRLFHDFPDHLIARVNSDGSHGIFPENFGGRTVARMRRPPYWPSAPREGD